MRRRPAWRACAWLWLLGGLPWGAALACGVCGGADRPASKTAFMVTTALMSTVPLASTGGLVYFLYRRKPRD